MQSLISLPIDRVVVYRNGALVVRRGSVSAGDMVVGGLPLWLDASTLRVHVDAGQLLQAKLGIDAVPPGPTAAPDDELRQAEADLLALTEQKSCLLTERRSLAELAPRLPTPKLREVPDGEIWVRWRRCEPTLAAWAEALDEDLAALKGQIEETRTRVAVLAEKARQASKAERLAQWIPHRQLALSLQGEGEIQLEVSYELAGASWVPSYQLLADRELRRGRLALRALVRNDTGEDWSDVQLTLATSARNRRVGAPDLKAVRLGSAAPPEPPSWRPLPSTLDDLFPAETRVLPPPPPPHRLEEKAKRVRRSRAVEPAPMMSAAAPAMALMAPKLVASGGAPAAQAPPPPSAVDEVPASLDYSRLRLMSVGHPDAGRLKRTHLEDELIEAGLSSDEVQRALECLRAHEARAHRTPPPGHVLPAPVEGVEYRFDAPGTLTIDANGRFRRVSLQDLPLNLEVEYRAVPREDLRVYRMARIHTDAGIPLLSGPVDIHIDGSLVLSTSWGGHEALGGDLELGLGPEDRLKLARNVRYSEESAGLFGGSRLLRTEIEIEIANSLSRPVQVELLERVPVKEAEEPKVELGSCTPSATPYTGEAEGPILAGGYQQRLQVPAGGVGKALFSYSVTLGSKEQIVGGDRRG